MSIGHSSSAYSFDCVSPSGSVTAAATMISRHPQKWPRSTRRRTSATSAGAGVVDEVGHHQLEGDDDADQHSDHTQMTVANRNFLTIASSYLKESS